jgi:hypothetical protein
MKNMRSGLTPSSKTVGGTLDDVEMGDGEVIRRRAWEGNGNGKTVGFELDECGKRVVRGVVSGLRRIMGICALYNSRRLSWDSSRVGRSSVRRMGEGMEARKEDDKRITCDFGDVPSRSPSVSFVGDAVYLQGD